MLAELVSQEARALGLAGHPRFNPWVKHFVTLIDGESIFQNKTSYTIDNLVLTLFRLSRLIEDEILERTFGFLLFQLIGVFECIDLLTFYASQWL